MKRYAELVAMGVVRDRVRGASHRPNHVGQGGTIQPPQTAPPLLRETTVEEWRRKDLSTCILQRDPECLPTRGQIGDLPSAYLCGQGQVCRRVGSREGLARAKATVESSYPVVGVTEELGASPTLTTCRHDPEGPGAPPPLLLPGGTPPLPRGAGGWAGRGGAQSPTGTP